MFSRDIGIDLGTANTLIYLRGKGIVLREPSVVAIDSSKKLLAVGSEAKRMVGRTPGSIVAMSPLKDGVIADYEITSMMLREFLRIVMKKYRTGRPQVVICVPSGVTEVEKRAVEDAALQAGARDAYLIEEPLAAAIGAGLPIDEPTGSMVVDIGGGTSEVAVISLSGISNSCSVRVGGTHIDAAIVLYAKKQYNLLIGERTAEDIKIGIGSAYPYENEGSMEVRGRDLVTGLPSTVMFSAAEIRECIKECIDRIIEGIRATLENTPPELAADIYQAGIMLTGGGALLRGIDRRIQEETGIKVNLAERPLDCVADGAGRVIETIKFRKVLQTTERSK